MNRKQPQNDNIEQIAEAVRRHGVIDRVNDYTHIDFRGSDPALREVLHAFVGENLDFSLGTPSGGFALPCLSCKNDILVNFPALQGAIQDNLHAGRTLTAEMYKQR